MTSLKRHVQRTDCHNVVNGERSNRGKLHHMGAQVLADVYGQETLERFRQLCFSHDPEGIFRNEWFDRLVFGDDTDHLELLLPAAPAFESSALGADATIPDGEQQ